MRRAVSASERDASSSALGLLSLLLAVTILSEVSVDAEGAEEGSGIGADPETALRTRPWAVVAALVASDAAVGRYSYMRTAIFRSLKSI